MTAIVERNIAPKERLRVFARFVDHSASIA
jgi:hypothetical protein